VPCTFDILVKESEQRLGVRSAATGFDAHPPQTPYDEIMSEILQQMEQFETEKLLRKQKQTKRTSVS
jgi:hypothetical protein